MRGLRATATGRATRPPISEISASFKDRRLQILITAPNVTFQFPIRPLIAALREILPQVETIESGVFAHIGLIAQSVLDAGRQFIY